MSRSRSLFAILMLATVIGCSNGSSTPAPAAPAVPAVPATPAPPPPPADPKAEADTIFANRCATCHGATGKGDTQVGQAMNPKPRDYTDAAWQKTIDDAYLAKVIVEGGPAVGKSPLMAPNIDLKDKPEVVKALVAKVRSFATAAADAPPATR